MRFSIQHQVVWDFETGIISVEVERTASVVWDFETGIISVQVERTA